MSRRRSFLAYLVILAGAVAGLANVAWWFVVPPGMVLLLWISDGGQHRGLVEKFPSLSPFYILALSIGGSLLNNAGAMAGGVGAWSVHGLGVGHLAW